MYVNHKQRLGRLWCNRTNSANIRTTCRVEDRKLVRALCLKTCRNISSFQQQDQHWILL